MLSVKTTCKLSSQHLKYGVVKMDSSARNGVIRLHVYNCGHRCDDCFTWREAVKNVTIQYEEIVTEEDQEDSLEVTHLTNYND